MRTRIFAAAVLALLASSKASFAFELGPDATAENTAIDIVKNTASGRDGQKFYCVHPRTKTSEQCRADFENTIEKGLELLARQILYLQARKRGESKQVLDRLRKEWETSREATLSASLGLERDYYPLKAETPKGK